MKSTRRVCVFLLLSLSCFAENCRGANREFPSRSAPSNFGQKQQIAQDAEPMIVRFESVAASIEERLAKFERELGQISSRLEGLDGKIDKMNDKLSAEPLNAQPSADHRVQLILWDEKISELDRKISELANQSDKHFVGAKNEPLHLKICDNTLIDIEVVSQQFNDSFKSFSEQLQRSVSRIDNLAGHLHDRLVENENNTESRLVDGSLDVERNERRVDDHTSLINGILSMVREKLKQQKEEEDDFSQITDSGSSTGNWASVEHVRPVRRNATSLPTRKGGLSFPHAKNKPAKPNATSFTGDSLGPQDIRVSKHFVPLFVLVNVMLDEIFVKCFSASRTTSCPL